MARELDLDVKISEVWWEAPPPSIIFYDRFASGDVPPNKGYKST